MNRDRLVHLILFYTIINIQEVSGVHIWEERAFFTFYSKFCMHPSQITYKYVYILALQ